MEEDREQYFDRLMASIKREAEKRRKKNFELARIKRKKGTDDRDQA